jgi:hypothetical protein
MTTHSFVYGAVTEGKPIQGNGDECFQSPDENGLDATVIVTGASSAENVVVVVWDPDAPCGVSPGVQDDSGRNCDYLHYVHATSMSAPTFEKMTAGAGPLVHSYSAAYFVDNGGNGDMGDGWKLPPEGTTGCYYKDKDDWNGCKVAAVAAACEKTWKVARFGNECPPSSAARRPAMPSSLLALGLMVAITVVVLWKKRNHWGSRFWNDVSRGPNPKQSYMELPTVPPEASSDA